LRAIIQQNEIPGLRKASGGEEALVAAAKNRDLKAFETLLFLYEKRIFNYIHRIVGQKQDAEDLAQETFIKLFRSLNRIDPDKNFRAWLFKIATNCVYDWLRKKRRNKEILLLDDPQSSFETINEKDPYLNIENCCDLAAAVAKIKPAYQSPVLLYYYQDFSYREIAKILSLPLNTVKIYLYRAKKELRRELTKTGKSR